MRINLNAFAKTLSTREGLKEAVNIAQIKEVLRLTLEELACLKPSEALEMIERHAPPKGPEAA